MNLLSIDRLFGPSRFGNSQHVARVGLRGYYRRLFLAQIPGLSPIEVASERCVVT